MENTTNLETNLILNILKDSFSKCSSKLKSLFTQRKLHTINSQLINNNFKRYASVTDAPFERDEHFYDNKYAKFYECLNAMPHIQKKVFLMKTFEQRKTSVICKNLDISETVFWYYIKKSRHELMVSLQLM